MIYVMIHFPLIILIKVGIAKDEEKRAKQVSRSVPGIAIPIFFLPVYKALVWEQRIHDTIRMFSVPFMGDGKNEWFLFIAAGIAIPFIIVVFSVQVGIVGLILYGLLYFFSNL